MTEKLLQYIWQFQYFNRQNLLTTGGEKVEILSAGTLNRSDGPDFSGALIKIGTTVFAGSVELHLKTSLWKDHGHHKDPRYQNVILHVVLRHNEDTTPSIPVLELEPLIQGILLKQYENFMHSHDFIPCAGSIGRVQEITWLAWKDRLAAERLTRKSVMVFDLLSSSQQHWEEVLWWMIARSYGGSANGEAFIAMARSIPLRVLARHRDRIQQVEALLLGQAGQLEQDFSESYPRLLQKEYRYLQKKYALRPIQEPLRFMRLRPASFPSLRLAQLAALVQDSVHLFRRVLDAEEPGALKAQFRIPPNDYWHYHYRPGEAGSYKIKTPGEDLVDHIIINALAPILFAYGMHHKEDQYKNKALRWLRCLPAEKNHITKAFRGLGLTCRSAFDSQALLELKAQYCNSRLCLNCSIGQSILSGQDQRTERAFL